MAEEKLLEIIGLDNGQRLEILDQSRLIGRETWLVVLKFRIKIEISKKIFDKIPSVSEDRIRKVLGPEVVYEVRHERNFIKEQHKDQVLNDLKDSFLKTNMKYLSHTDFSHKFILKKYNEKTKNR